MLKVLGSSLASSNTHTQRLKKMSKAFLGNLLGAEILIGVVVKITLNGRAGSSVVEPLRGMCKRAATIVFLS